MKFKEYNFLLVIILLFCEIIAIYGFSINMGLVGDDWFLINDVVRQGYSVFLPTGYHYNPIPKLLIFAVYDAFGLQSVSYHIVALALAWLAAVLVVRLGWMLTGRLVVGALAGALFCAFGSHYEALAWGTVAFWYTTVVTAYLLGLIFYIRSHDSSISPRNRRWSYLGFLLALTLAPFAHELGITLIGACALYRATVLEKWSDLDRAKARELVAGWVRDFSIPFAIVIGYLGLKWYLGRQTDVSQVPGLKASWDHLTYTASQGMFRAFIPGTGPHQLNDLLNRAWGLSQQRNGDVLQSYAIVVFGCILIGLIVLCRYLRPVPRFLILWIVMLCCAQTIGLGAIQPRHLYLMSIPSATLWAIILLSLVNPTQRVLERLAWPRAARQYLKFLPTALGSSLLAIIGTSYAVEQLESWQKAAERVDEVISQVEQLTDDTAPNSTLYLINLPDHAVSQSGEWLWMFRNAARPSIELSLPGRFVDVVPIRTVSVPDWADSASFATIDQLEQYEEQPQTVLLEYDDAVVEMRRWKPLPRLEELQPLSKSAEGFLDTVDGVVVSRAQEQPLVLTGNGPVRVTGWAVDDVAGTLARGVVVLVDDRRQYWADYGRSRPDIANYFDNPALENAGFEVMIPGGDLERGVHTLQIKIIASDGLSYYGITEPWQQVEIAKQ